MTETHLVVDGSNIATEGRTAPSLAQLNDAVTAFIADHEFDKQGNIVHKDELAKREKAAKTMQKGKEKAKKEREKNEPHTPEILEAKKEKLLQEGMMKADVKKQVKEYEEKLMGNSKMGQDITGKIKKR